MPSLTQIETTEVERLESDSQAAILAFNSYIIEFQDRMEEST